MYWTNRHVLVCTASHCAQKGANEMLGKLRLEIVRQGLDSQILINNCGTIDLCDIGPNLVVYPDNVILSGVQAKDVKRLVAYLQGEGDMDEFVTSPTSTAEVRRHDLYQEAAGVAPLTEPAFTEIVEKHGFDAAWIDEQARRGFIARKPGEDGAPSITITTKARTRYAV
ncbi:MAG: (2Fe-2S) ferredoxin domain-containing protein [Thermomicrobiales bacterium]|nr:(2Fe-2S) ferredoxin domain-containing protein [Thermomicrobiales bacterium]